jgi:hypothetical protein
VWVEPYEHLSLDVNPALHYIDAVNFYEFSVTPNTSIAAGNYILLEFKTDDEQFDNLFDVNLGKTIPVDSSL